MRTKFDLPAQATAWGIAFLRIVLGWTAIMHGWVKLQNGVDGTAGFFSSLGIPLPEAAAVLVIAVEVVGGAALILGVGTRVVGFLLATVMAVAMVTVHSGQGFFASQGGYELVLVLTAGYLAVALVGPGALAVSTLIARVRRNGVATGHPAIATARGA